MSTNGNRWLGGAVAVITLILGIAGVLYAGAIKRIEINEADVRRIDKNQAVIIFQLKGINGKLDQLLEE